MLPMTSFCGRIARTTLFSPSSLQTTILSRFKSSSSTNKANVANVKQDPKKLSPSHSTALRFRPGRSVTKKRLVPGKDAWSVIGYSTADNYNLISLSEKLQEQGIYSEVPLEEDLTSQCLCVRSKYNVDQDQNQQDEAVKQATSRDIFFFADGSVIFWNVPQLERDTVLTFLRAAKSIEDEPFDEATIFEESEMMNYELLEPNGNGQVPNSRLDKGLIKLQQSGEANTILEKYAFSNAMAASVKLGMLEATLDRIIDSIEFVAEDLKRGAKIQMTQAEVLKKTGEIFALRHVVNLSSDLLDVPDFYWDREGLEILYQTTCAHLALGKRTRVMNEKLTHCCELMDLLTTHLNDKHHVRLEWFIIILIMVEVVFELLHFMERFT